MKIKTVFFAILMLPNFLTGNMVETSQFEDVLTYIEQNPSKNILLVCDIDNTLLRASQHLGSVAWGDYIIAQLERKGIAKQQAQEIEDIFWLTVQPFVKVENVDPKAPTVIQEIHNRNISILGLTARTPEEAEYTAHQLLSLDIDLSADEQFPSFSTYLAMEKYDALYDKGILFGSPFNKKSKVLFTFLEKFSLSPECIIFIDDKWDHVEDVANACFERSITYMGFRFNAADEHVKNFDPLLADIQWHAFPSVLTNEQAQQFLWNYLHSLKKHE